jgi:hypothetical protein
VDNPEHLFTDADECVMLRLRDDVITVEVSLTGFRRPPAEIARCVVEAAERLPRPGGDVAASLDADLAAIGGLQAALAIFPTYQGGNVFDPNSWNGGFDGGGAGLGAADGVSNAVQQYLPEALTNPTEVQWT